MERSLALFALCQQQRRAKQPIQQRDKRQRTSLAISKQPGSTSRSFGCRFIFWRPR